ESIRNHKKYLMGFLMLLIIPSFVLFGVKGFDNLGNQGEVVATVDGQEITKPEWDRAHQVESQRMREAMPSVDPKLLDSDAARYAVLERLVRDRVLAVAAQKLKLYTSDQRLARDLQQNETIAALRGPDGKLDVEAYRQLVGRQGMTPEMFEASVRADLSQRQVAMGVQGTGFAPSALAEVSLNAFFERREVRSARFLASDFAARVTPTDAEIEAFYKDHPALFQAPEEADIEYLVLDAQALEKGVELNPADVRSYYDQNAARLSGSEERKASHILRTVAPGASAADKEKVRQETQALLDQVRQAPQTFAEVARKNSQDPGSAPNGGDLDFFARGAMVKAFEDVAFALPKGGISDLVETEYGFHIIQLTDIRAPKTRSFEDMRAEIEADLKKQQAQKRFVESAEAFTNLVYEKADTLQAAADRLKLQVQTAKGLQRQPKPDAGSVLSNERLLNAIFAPDAIEKKHNTEAIETGSGQLVSARVVRYSPAHTQALAEVRDLVRARLVSERSLELARQEGEKQLALGKTGAAITGLSAPMTVSRDNAQGMAAPVLAVAMSADPKQLPAWVGVKLPDQGYTVVQVLKTLPREAGDAARQSQEVMQYSQWWSAAEGLAYYDTLKERFKVHIAVPAPAAVPLR
ncbi:SurA N-terminal domain-containing protein, partial [Hydrogenophaga sp.]|uniref:SurA N-terminal domain-containing protein n=1 Tax=Hydrogenophaga sp. TaxID=1904254 RepID=UPI003563E743